MWAKKAGGVGTDNAESIALSNVKYPVDAPYRDVYITGTIQVAPLAVSLHLLLAFIWQKTCHSRENRARFFILISLILQGKAWFDTTKTVSALSSLTKSLYIAKYNTSDGAVQSTSQSRFSGLCESMQFERFCCRCVVRACSHESGTKNASQ